MKQFTITRTVTYQQVVTAETEDEVWDLLDDQPLSNYEQYEIIRESLYEVDEL